MLSNYSNGVEAFYEGDIVELDKATTAMLIKAGYALEVEEQAKDQIEEAIANAPVEKAISRKKK